MKLSEAQKAVIKKMQQGYQLIEWFTGNSFALSLDGSVRQFVRYTTYEKLKIDGLISVYKNEYEEYIYTLTEKGKTIEI